MLRRRRPPVERLGVDSYAFRLEANEREVLSRLLDELDGLIAGAGDPAVETTPVVSRLFPPAFTDHDGENAERDAEYQRLMREELIASRRAALAESRSWLDPDSGEQSLNEATLTSIMRSLNSLRLVLGSLLGIVDDLDSDLADEAVADSPDHQLYAWTGWLLEWTVTALSTPE